MVDPESLRKKEFRIIFNTEEGTAVFETPNILGKLNCIIVDSNEKISFTIDSKLGYCIYHTSEHSGINYYAPRAILRGQKLINFNLDSYDKFKLNEPLDIRVSGPKNTKITMIIRVD